MRIPTGQIVSGQWLARHFRVPSHYQAVKMTDWQARLCDMAGPEGTFVFGPPGTGKTHLAATLLVWLNHAYLGYESREQAWNEAWNWCRLDISPWLSADLIMAANDAWDARVHAELEGILADTPLLVVDDVAEYHYAGRHAESFKWAIDQRLNSDKPLIVTSNLSLKQIDSVHPRLASRLSGMRHVHLGGKDRRTGHHKVRVGG